MAGHLTITFPGGPADNAQGSSALYFATAGPTLYGVPALTQKDNSERSCIGGRRRSEQWGACQ